jgi:hypothetical protein
MPTGCITGAPSIPRPGVRCQPAASPAPRAFRGQVCDANRLHHRRPEHSAAKCLVPSRAMSIACITGARRVRVLSRAMSIACIVVVVLVVGRRRMTAGRTGPGRVLARRRDVFEPVERIDEPGETLPPNARELAVFEPGDTALLNAGQLLELPLRKCETLPSTLHGATDQLQPAPDPTIGRPDLGIPIHAGHDIDQPFTRAYPISVMQPVGIAKRKSARIGGGARGCWVVSDQRDAAGWHRKEEVCADWGRRPGGWAGRGAKGGRGREATQGFRGSVRPMTKTDQVPT